MTLWDGISGALFIIISTVVPWLSCSKGTTTEGKNTHAKDAEFSAVLQMLDSFPPQHHPTKDTPMFKESKNFALLLKLSTFTFTSLLGIICFFGGALHKIKSKEILNLSHNDLNITDNSVGLTDSFSSSTELGNACVGIENFCF
jgi:hypothetical protein